jgi:hypothetical protein
MGGSGKLAPKFAIIVVAIIVVAIVVKDVL